MKLYLTCDWERDPDPEDEYEVALHCNIPEYFRNNVDVKLWKTSSSILVQKFIYEDDLSEGLIKLRSFINPDLWNDFLEGKKYIELMSNESSDESTSNLSQEETKLESSQIKSCIFSSELKSII